MKKCFVLIICVFVLLAAVSCKGAEKLDYDEIINMYTDLLTKEKAGEEINGKEYFSKAENELNIISAVYEIVENCEDPSLMGYSQKDINGDGVKELIFLDKALNIKALFTEVDSTPILLDTFNNWGVIDQNGEILNSSTIEEGGSLTSYYYVKKLEGGKLAGTEVGRVFKDKNDTENVEFYKSVNGERTVITKQEALELDEVYGMAWSTGIPSEKTKKANIRFVPVFEDAEDKDAERKPADFSSYDSIIEMYKNMVGYYKNWARSKWVCGEYDGKLIFANDTEYEWYNAILQSGFSLRPTKEAFSNEYAVGGNKGYCYALKDTNSDGSDELILLMDTYELIAIFTMKEGKPVLLDTFDSVKKGWLDEKGNVYVDIQKDFYGAVRPDREKMVYTITSDGEKNVTLHIGCSVDGMLKPTNTYKMEKGKKISVSQSEWEGLEKQHNVIPVGWTEEEYTREKSNITLKRLFSEPKINDGFSGEWRNSNFSIFGNSLEVLSLGLTEFYFELVILDGNGNEIRLPGKASSNKGKFEFDVVEAKGWFEIGAKCVWMIVEQSGNDAIECRSYLFNSFSET